MSEAAFHIAFFGHDANESTVVKRAEAFMASGCRVTGFMFRRRRPGLDRRAAFRIVELGATRDRGYLGRLPRLVAGLVRTVREARLLREADAVYARNIDMLVVAILALTLTRSRARLVYEVLDVQRVFLRPDLVGSLFRWVERMSLRRCGLLVVSSPDFVTAYFHPVQGFGSNWRLLENKVSPLAGRTRAAKPQGPPWIIGWFGTLRCRRSLAMLCGLADALGDRIEVHLRGRPSLTDLPVEEIDAAVRTRPNMIYGGGYDNPAELPAIYGPVHFTWCVDYTDSGANSDWLLPNRIYEGGLYGAVALARAHTATGRMVQRNNLGFWFDEPLADAIKGFFAALDPDVVAAARASLAAMPVDTFVDLHDTADLVAAMRQLPAAPARHPTSTGTSNRPDKELVA